MHFWGTNTNTIPGSVTHPEFIVLYSSNSSHHLMYGITSFFAILAIVIIMSTRRLLCDFMWVTSYCTIRHQFALKAALRIWNQNILFPQWCICSFSISALSVHVSFKTFCLSHVVYYVNISFSCWLMLSKSNQRSCRKSAALNIQIKNLKEILCELN